jgi:hypothetical protein
MLPPIAMASSAIWPPWYWVKRLIQNARRDLPIAIENADLRIYMHQRNALNSADPYIAARHVIGKLLGLFPHSVGGACVADLLADHVVG